MTVTFVVLGGWILLDAALAIALLILRRDRPEARAKLFAWVMQGERRRPRPTPVLDVRSLISAGRKEGRGSGPRA
jgi:hypothetical protein